GVSWGHLTIAHTLAANTTAGVPAERLVALHARGLDWGSVAAGLGLDLADVVSAVRAEAHVATGVLPADGKVAIIRADRTRAEARAPIEPAPALSAPRPLAVAANKS